MSVLMRLSSKGGVRHAELFNVMQKHAEDFASGNLLMASSWGRSDQPAAKTKCRSASEESHRKRFSLTYERQEARLLRAGGQRSGSSCPVEPSADAA